MLQLAVLRHAKSSWEMPGQADFDRGLTPRGLEAAPAMGRHMRDIGLEPDLVLCSPARRARETAELALGALSPVPPRIEYDRMIYGATAESLASRLRRISENTRCVLLIGHNPGLQDLVMALVRRPLAGTSGALEDKFPTATLAVLELPFPRWSDLTFGRAHISHVMTPRRLRALSTGPSA